jgi:hypothetical protein
VLALIGAQIQFFIFSGVLIVVFFLTHIKYLNKNKNFEKNRKTIFEFEKDI